MRKALLPILTALRSPAYYGNRSNSLSAAKTAAMADEYGALGSSGETFITRNFPLEFGPVLEEAHLRFNTYGRLNDARDNVLVVCHALTGNSQLDQWWGAMMGPGQPFDTDKYYIICTNILGSCYGSSGPSSINPSTNRPYGMSFPAVSLRDSVTLQIKLLKDHLRINSIQSVIGGSLGGMQALEWSILGGSLGMVRSAVIIGCGARHTAWQIAISETQRQAIYSDSKWQEGEFQASDPPNKGLAVARMMAMTSYRSAASYDSKFGRNRDEKTGLYDVQSYLHYQGQKFLSRFDAVTYVKLTQQMDTHDVGRNRGGIETALKTITCPVLVMGMDSDVLYPLREQQELARLIPKAKLEVIETINGHDGFLLEQDQVGGHIQRFLSELQRCT